jgi:hypothetical protein
MALWKSLVTFVLLHAFYLITPQAQSYEALKAEAEKYYAEGSYSLAGQLYLKADALDLPPSEARWVDFWLADTLWRAHAATHTYDPAKYDHARRQLEVLIRDIERHEDRDQVWAEAQESLADFWWRSNDSWSWKNAWPHFEQALDWWANAHDIEAARERYIKIVWKIYSLPGFTNYEVCYDHRELPPELLENVLRIATRDGDKARAHFHLGMALRQPRGEWDQRHRAPEEFEAVLQFGRSSEWYDDALYHYAEWLGNGRIVPGRADQQRQEPDYVKALELFRRLIEEHRQGGTRYYMEASRWIDNITRPVADVIISNVFLPDAEIQFYVNWRNVKTIDFTLYKVNLPRDVQFASEWASSFNWIYQVDLAGREVVRSWSKDTGDKGDYKPGQEAIRLDRLPVGAYVIEARSGQLRDREALLVTDTSLVLKASEKQALVYFCNALDGSPIAQGQVTLWEQVGRVTWKQSTKETNQDGLAVFDLAEPPYSRSLFVSAALNDRQAFSTGYGSYPHDQSWRIYPFPDRPAYRPGETAQWKFIARTYDGSVYSTPANQVIEYEIQDPRGITVKKEKVTLNAFGSAWGSLTLSESMPLGTYVVIFWTEGRGQDLGREALFRLEEYKLPEFKVRVLTPEDAGRKKVFRPGEKVDVTIQAEYYFGGPVTNATVEVLVYQNPFYPRWEPPREFYWYYYGLGEPYPSFGGGYEIMKRAVLSTDADGRTTLSFDTPRSSQMDYDYFIEARVTDAARREIVGVGSVRATRQPYYVYPRARHNLYRPQDRVHIDFKTLDANNQPMEVEGSVQVTRDYWYEIWLDPNGREVAGEELKRLRAQSRTFPPPPEPGKKPWQLKFEGYQHDDLLTRAVKTTAEGEADFIFTPERDGYYRFTWSSTDDRGALIKAETTVWVATDATTDLGYRHGGLEILADQDTLRAGQKSPVLLSAPATNRYVLFSVEGDNLFSYQLVHLTGSVRLVEIEIKEQHVPNIFLNATMVSDRQIFTDTQQVIVPPIKHFLDVEVKADRQQYQPREEGTLTVLTRDDEGKPVAAEVGLGLVDESIYYIQQDYFGNPGKYFYDRNREQRVNTQSTFQEKGYAARDEALTSPPPALIATAPAEAMTVGSVGVTRGAPGSPDLPPVPEPRVQVRRDFRTTAFWQPNVVTGKDGKATVKVKFPDSLTSWRATARVSTSGNQFGVATTTTRTSQPLIVRLQAPRFFVVGDEAIVSAVINNNTDKPMGVNPPVLEADGVIVKEMVSDVQPINSRDWIIVVAPNGEERVDWVVSAQRPGQAKLRVTARGNQHADAMEKSYPIYEHGIEKFVAKSGKVRGDEVTVRLDIPKERQPESTTLTVQVTPSLAVMMLDALPYLIDYPYGCTEQTMSRFLPAVIVARTLKDLGLPPEAISGKIFGGLERQHLTRTQPKGQKDLRQLDQMVNQGLQRLYDFQHRDGGWGWWKEGESDPYMTAYVIWGLTRAREAGIEVNEETLKRGAEFLEKELVEAENEYDRQAWMLHALAAHHPSSKQDRVSEYQIRAVDNLRTNRDKLNAYTRALLALSARQFGYADRAQTLIRNLENGVKIDRTPDTSVVMRGPQVSHEAVIGTAHWGEDGIYWRWSDGGVEATSFALRALLLIDPQNKLIEPVTNWLIKNRRGAQWSNTRDTAIAILALNDYLRQSGEMNPDLEYELLVNGQSIATKRVTAADVLSAPSQFEIDRQHIKDGANEIRLVRRSGSGPIYFAAQAKFFSLEEPITPAGHEIFVRRQYYKLVGRPTLLRGYVYDRQPINDGESVASGDRIETVVTIEAKNNYEYLVLEDLKPAGLEAIQIRSGESLYAKELESGAVTRQTSDLRPQTSDIDYTGRTRWVYQELRDRKVALFIDKLPEGVWEIRYDMRAEVPGRFHALPLMGYAMYVPEIRSNDVEVRINVEDRK